MKPTIPIAIMIATVLTAGCTLADACKDNEYRQEEICIPCPDGKIVNKTRDACLDTIKSCGVLNTDCVATGNGVASAECTNGICQVVKCYEGYFPSKDNTICYEGGSSPENCGANGINCMTEGVLDAICHESKCKALKCDGNYHLSQDQTTCAQDTISECGSYDNDCMAENLHTQEAMCNDKACYIITCQPNYHIENANDGFICAEDNINACGPNPVNCTTLLNTTNHQCIDGICKYNCSSNTEKLNYIDGCHYCPANDLHYTEAKVNISEYECTRGNVTLSSTCPNDPRPNACWFKSDSLIYVGGVLEFEYWAEENSYVLPQIISFPKLQYAQTLWLHDTTLDYHPSETPPYNNVEFAFDALAHTDQLIITGIGSDYLEFPELETIKDRLTINNNQVTDFYFSVLKSIGNDDLLKLDEFSDDYYALTIQNSVQSVETPVYNFYFLKQITGGVRLINNHAYFRFESLETIKGKLEITGGKNDMVTDIELPALKNIISTSEEPLTIMDMPNLSYLDIHQLKKIGDGKIIIHNCPKLTKERCNLGENECILQ